MSLELIHLLVFTPLLLFFASFGGIYAIKALTLLSKNPEIMKIHRKIWLPILDAGILLVIATFVLIGEHFAEPPLLRDMLQVLSEAFVTTSLAFLAIGVFQYWRLQARYIQQKREAQRKLVEH